MKITSASKKVLASALSAAMVVAFAPTAAFAWDKDGNPTTDADYVSLGSTVKLTYSAGAESGQVTGATNALYFDNLANALAAAQKLVDPSNGFTPTGGTEVNGQTSVNITLLADQTPKAAASDTHASAGYTLAAAAEKTYTIDLNGFSISNQVTGQTSVQTTTGYYTSAALEITGTSGNNGGVVLKDSVGTGKINGNKIEKATDDNKDQSVYAVKAANAVKLTVNGITAGDVFAPDTLNSGTYGKIFNDNSTEALDIKGSVKTGAIADRDGNNLVVTLAKGASLEVSAAAKKNNSVGITGSVSAADAATLTVNASADEGTATGVLGSVSMAKGTASVTAKGYGATIGVFGSLNAKTATVSADSSTADAYGVTDAGYGTAEVADPAKPAAANTVTVADGSVSASGATTNGSVAVAANKVLLSGGTYTGKLVVLAGYNAADNAITGGTFTANPKALVDTTEYDIASANDVYTVTQFKGFNVASTNKGLVIAGAGNVLSAYANDLMSTIAAGATSVAGVTLAEGVTLADLVKQAKDTDAPLKIAYDYKTYVEKSATDAQKAAKEAVDAAVKADLNKAVKDQAYTLAVTLQYTTKAGETVTMATVTDLGTYAFGLSTADRVISVDLGGKDKTVWAYAGGKAAKQAYTDPKNPGTVEFRAIPDVIVVSEIDPEAVKDAAEQKPETPVVTEKATQGIDVSKKSLTVKLGAKKTKTAKAKSFAMGASAETELTTAKKSGSSKITVSGDKVKLAKGAKRGTYTAKVSLKAAASDAYLAAAKTITVKFVIK